MMMNVTNQQKKRKRENLIYIDFGLTGKSNIHYTIYPIVYHEFEPFVLKIPVFEDTMYTWKWKRGRYDYVNNFMKFIRMDIDKKNKSTIKFRQRSNVHIKYNVFGMFNGSFEYNNAEDLMTFTIRDGNEVRKYYLQKKNNKVFVDTFGKTYEVVKL